MVKVVARFAIKEGKLEEYKAAAAELVAETRKEKGCISYQLCQDTNNAKMFSFIEEWESQEALDTHMKSEHFLRILPKLGQFQEGNTEVSLYKPVL